MKSAIANVQNHPSFHPFAIWSVLLILIGINAELMALMGSALKTILICSGFLIKGVLVVNYLMGLYSSPKWIQWPMLAYFGVFAVLFMFCFIW